MFFDFDLLDEEVMARIGEQLFDWQLLDWAEVLATLEGSGLQADWALSSGRESWDLLLADDIATVPIWDDTSQERHLPVFVCPVLSNSGRLRFVSGDHARVRPALHGPEKVAVL
ncbi:unnamed protein product [Symbiodinium sp. KB8]|nr:unnamed protein product [Symbiodinium sp. KB8]